MTIPDCVTSYTKNSATLKSGKKIEFDILVLAVGVRANIGLIKDIGGECNRGIIVNSKLETSISDIYAAGDCSEGFDISLGKNRVLALLPNAYMQGEVAGKNMALSSTEKSKSLNNDSQDIKYFEYTNGIPVNSMGLLGLHIVTAGTYEGNIFIRKPDNQNSNSEKMNFKKLFYDKTLKGFIIIGDIKRSGIYSNLIRKQIPLSEIDFNLMCEEPALLPFTKVERENMLSKLH